MTVLICTDKLIWLPLNLPIHPWHARSEQVTTVSFVIIFMCKESFEKVFEKQKITLGNLLRNIMSFSQL